MIFQNPNSENRVLYDYRVFLHDKEYRKRLRFENKSDRGHWVNCHADDKDHWKVMKETNDFVITAEVIIKLLNYNFC